MTNSGHKSKTDWDRVKREYDSDAPIPYDPNNPDDGPYDPNDDEAVDRFLTEANLVHPAPKAANQPTSKAS